MSTILDALKKSEQERKLSNVPTLADMPTPQESSRWPHILLLFIIVLLLVLIGFAVKLTMFPSQISSVPHLEKGGAEQTVTEQSEPIDVNHTQDTVSDDQVIVNVVSYSPSPEKRFIMIGDKLVKEGEFVRAGLKVEEIRHNEVVLNLRGKQITRRP